MLLIDKLIDIVPLKSATAIMYVKKNGFYVLDHMELVRKKIQREN